MPTEKSVETMASSHNAGPTASWEIDDETLLAHMDAIEASLGQKISGSNENSNTREARRGILDELSDAEILASCDAIDGAAELEKVLSTDVKPGESMRCAAPVRCFSLTLKIN